MRIVALQTVGRGKWLPLVRLNERIAFDVVAIHAKCRNTLGQMFVELNLAGFPGLVSDVTGVAAHVECGVAAAFRGHIQALGMAIETQVLTLFTAGRFQQLVLVVGLVGIVALDAIAHCGRMHSSLERSGVFIRMAGQAEGLRRRGDQFDARDVFVDANLMATRAAHLDGGVDGLAFGLIFVTFQAGLGVCFCVQRNRMDRAEEPRRNQQCEAQSE